jgi:AefR-like transcriptional repressor, C-terminal domain
MPSRRNCTPAVTTTSPACNPSAILTPSSAINSCAAQEPCHRCARSSPSRIVPELGREFYETGPAERVTKLCHYLESQVAAGILTIEDCEVAASQFLDSCVATILKPLLFNAGEAPSDERIDHVVGIAVHTFLAAYQRVA